MATLIAAFVAMPIASASAAPANVEYGYETIPGVSDGTSRDGDSLVAANGGSTGGPAADGGSESGSSFLGVISTSWLLIVVVLFVAALIGYIAWHRHRSGLSSPGFLTRAFALLGVLIVIPLITLGGAQSAKRSAAPNNFFGVITQTDFTAKDATRMSRGGIESLRVPLAWPSVQPEERDEFNWEAADQLIGTAARSGMTILPFLYDAPSWLVNKNNRLPVNNANARSAWTAFVRATVERYGRGGEFWAEHGPDSDDPIPAKPVKTWQVWNEANFFFFANPVSPSKYKTLLKITDKAVNKVDPRAKIMLSGLYGSPPQKQIRRGKAMLSYKFLDRLYKSGAKRHFDIAALHPYTPNTRETKILVNRFRAVMAKRGDRRKPMSITEVGWGSARNGFLDVGSKAKQAKQVKSAYRYFLGSRKKNKLQSVYWFSWKDKKRSEPSCNFCYSTGFFKSANGLKSKPAWKQFTRFSGGRP